MLSKDDRKRHACLEKLFCFTSILILQQKCYQAYQESSNLSLILFEEILLVMKEISVLSLSNRCFLSLATWFFPFVNFEYSQCRSCPSLLFSNYGGDVQLMRCCKTTGPVNSLFLELKCFMNKNNGAKFCRE